MSTGGPVGGPAGLVGRGLMILAAAGCLAAGVGGWRYWHDAEATHAVARSVAAARLDPASDPFRPEGEEAGPPARAAEAHPPVAQAEAPAATPTPPPRPALPRATAKAGEPRGCAPRCGVSIALVSPPRRPESLRTVPPATDGLTGMTAAAPSERTELLGLALPFVPTTRTVMRGVADLSEDLTGAVADLVVRVR